MAEPLNEVEIRILGCLVEKQLTTPEYYPLTLNALTAACNQRSNRDPVVSYDETTILRSIDELRDRNLVYLFYGSSSRTVKYKHMLPSYFQLTEAETAVLTVLMLRGPQTLGEIRERTGRLHEFGGIGEVQQALDEMAARVEPVVIKLERQPGQKEARYAHLLSGEVDASSISAPKERVPTAANEKVEMLEQEIEMLKQQLAELRTEFDTFRSQFG